MTQTEITKEFELTPAEGLLMLRLIEHRLRIRAQRLWHNHVNYCYVATGYAAVAADDALILVQDAIRDVESELE